MLCIHIDYICVSFLQCVFSNVPSNYLPKRMQSYIKCICFLFCRRGYNLWDLDPSPLRKMWYSKGNGSVKVRKIKREKNESDDIPITIGYIISHLVINISTHIIGEWYWYMSAFSQKCLLASPPPLPHLVFIGNKNPRESYVFSPQNKTILVYTENYFSHNQERKPTFSLRWELLFSDENCL